MIQNTAADRHGERCRLTRWSCTEFTPGSTASRRATWTFWQRKWGCRTNRVYRQLY